VHATARDWVLLLTLALMWGTAFLATGVAVAALPPASVVAGRLVLGGVVLAGLVRARGLAWPRGVVWRYYAALGFFGNALPFVLISWGQQRVPSGLASILVAVMPLATLGLATRWVPDERLTARRVAGFALGFIGLAVLVGPDALRGIGGDPSMVVRQLAIVLAAVSYAVNAILVRGAPARPLLVNTAGMVVAAAIMILPLAVVLDGVRAEPVGWTVVVAVGWLGVVCTAAASIVYLAVIRAAGPTFFSLINYLVPLVAVAAGRVALGEHTPPRAVLALAVILAGLALGERRSIQAVPVA